MAKSKKRFAKREEEYKIKVVACNLNAIGEINKENARKNLPSSMR